METNGTWLSILDYSKYRKVSISTVRRYIKAERVNSKLEDGKYYIFVSDDKLKKSPIDSDIEEVNKLKQENERLKFLVNQLKEENLELKMLVDIYEKQNISEIPSSVLQAQDEPPAIPFS